MAIRKVFYSFHYKPDNWRASQVRNIGAIEGNKPASDNDWEEVTKGGDAAIKKWIDTQMSGRSCAVVLIGNATKDRKWIDYEIEKAWNDGKGLVGVFVHGLKDSDGSQATKGGNPFDGFVVGKDKTKLNAIVKAYDTPYTTSSNVYKHISENIADWIEEAVANRKLHS